MKATWNGAVIAESDDTVVVEGNHYFPYDSVNWDLLTPTETHTVWTVRAQNRIATPVVYNGSIYWVSRGIANCISAETGDEVFKSRVPGAAASGGSSRGRGGPGGDRGRGGFGGRGGSGGGPGGQDYASPIVVDGKLIVMTRSGLTHVLNAGTEFELIAQNRFESDGSDFNATPAASDGQLFIRSNEAIYCVANMDSN